MPGHRPWSRSGCRTGYKGEGKSPEHQYQETETASSATGSLAGMKSLFRSSNLRTLSLLFAVILTLPLSWEL